MTIEPTNQETSATQDPEDLRLLSPDGLAFRDEGARLQMRRAEEEWREVRLARLFPMSEPEGWLSVLAADGKEEIGILMALRGLSRESVAALRAELRRRYLIPQIVRVLHCRNRFDLTEWRVETDRGEATFLLRNPQENMTQPRPGRVMFTDVEGNRYDVPDLNALDEDSRRWLEERL